MTKTTTYTKPENVHGASRSSAGVIDRQNSLGAHVCVQRDAVSLGVRPHAPALVREVLNSPGQALDAETRTFMEPRFGYDFSGVRVHTDEAAAESARAVSAHAFAAGSHVVFGEGKYAPGTIRGRHLVAHELEHVIQQASGYVEGEHIDADMSVSHPADVHEQKAEAKAGTILEDHNSDLASLNGCRPVRSTSRTDGIQVQRYDDPNESAQRSADYAEGSLISGSIIGGLGLLGSLAGLIISGKTLAATRRQADAAEDPPVPQPTQGGVTSTHVDKIDEIKGPSAAVDDTESMKVADVTSKADRAKGLTTTRKTTTKPDGTIVVETETKKGKEVVASEKKTSKEAEKAFGDTDRTFTVLRLQEGAKNRAEFKLKLKSNQRDIKGGNTEDGDIIGYTGGSVASNATVGFKAGPGTPLEDRATVRLAFAGTNTPPRMVLGAAGKNDAPTKTDNSPQRFSGSMLIDAKMNVVDDSVLLSVNPLGTSTKKAGDGKGAPIVVVGLNAVDSAPVAEPVHLNAPPPVKQVPPPKKP
jgi:hypothetical protein